ncbi:MAG: hypothetical protein HYW34_01095 [Candidatus Brennerbacteria bacterium]|nr:hypothetical protein [Candidatus Brennerbacteria bacterium]
MLLLILGMPVAANAFQLVPVCNGPCMSICNLAQLGKNIIDFMVWIIFPIATAVMVYGGIMFIFSGGSPGKVEKGKSAIKSAVIGIAIMAFAWLLVNGVIQIMNGGSAFSWSTITCNK